MIMIAFHDTLWGRRFFDSQLPELVKAIKSIAASLAVIAERQRTTDTTEKK